MAAHKSTEQSNNIADQAAQSADHAIKSTQRVANEALDSLADSVQDLRHQVAPLLNRATEQASAFAHRGIDRVRETSQHLRANAVRASDGTVSYIKEEPIKAMLIAAATGALLMGLISLMNRSRDPG
jgi:ElaB/YqjD/DUF883 family membrane-anchored ribosome-binding protein